MNKHIYLDHAATTPIDPEVFEAMRPYFTEKFGNPMSVHSFGQEAMKAVDEARQTVADFLQSQPSEIIFTSGATESNNLAIKGILKSCANQNRKEKPHVIISQIEHHCVLDTVKKLEKEGAIESTYLPVYKDGIVKVEDVKNAVKPNTVLISIMYVNNEIGTVQPIVEIGKYIQEKKRSAQNSWEKIYPLFHTDATQAVNYFDCDVAKLGVDLLSFSGHKIYGPKGVGVLYVKKRTPILRIQDGGDQEYHLRAGTHNVSGIAGLGKAISLIWIHRTTPKMLELRNYLIEKVLKEIPRSYLNGSREFRSPNNANFRFDDVEGEGLLLSLDMEGIAASTGSACSSGALEPSHVLLALGLKHEQAHGSLRVTLGKDTTRKEIDYTISKIKEVVERLRKISGSILTDYNK